MSNQLANETSPYLLQHANNPVNWCAWGPEALQRANAEDKPIFLSIGYSACHWCHVMEHESFEDPQIAQLLNESFVCIKVDREERPDLDQIYMNAVQLLTGRGGWPMSVFLTPQLRPFYGGTYWPPRSRMGMPGFDQVVTAVSEAWRNRRSQAENAATEITDRLAQIGTLTGQSGPLDENLLTAALAKLERMFDFRHGGFGSAPKFPHAMDLQVLLRIWRRSSDITALEMVRLNLDKMAAGGIYDHLAGGFARYSVDERWLVPHFEKMLYDNALLTLIYTEAFQATGSVQYENVVRETLHYILTYMTDEQGGFHSTEDADSEGEEGKFYLWTPAEIREALGPEQAELFCLVYDVTSEGNFEGKNILNLPKSIDQFAQLRGLDVQQLRRDLVESRARLLTVRDQRVRPGKDDKILVSWNALMIDAMARAGAVLGDRVFEMAAVRAAEFVLNNLRDASGRLLHTWRHGKAKLPAYLDDYAYLTNALITLYETTFEERWIDEAAHLAEYMIAHFADPNGDGFFFTADNHESLITRNKDFYDSSVPSGNAMAATALLRLGHLAGRQEYLRIAHQTLSAAQAIMQQSPTAAGQLLVALDLWIGPFYEVAVFGKKNDSNTDATLRSLQSHFWPTRVIAFRDLLAEKTSPVLDPLFEGKVASEPWPTVYLCRDFACEAPIHGAKASEIVTRTILSGHSEK